MKQIYLTLFIHIVWLACIEAQVKFQWKQLQFAYKTNKDRKADINAGIYNPKAPAAIDVDAYYTPKNKLEPPMVFVSIPKFVPGVPATFGTVTHQKHNCDREIQPFPSWEWHRDTKECRKDRLVSVFRVKIDSYGLLWILDSGNEGNGVICTPQLLAFDLEKWPKVKTPLFRYELHSSVYLPHSVFVTPILQHEYKNGQISGFAYLADTSARSIVVVNLKNKEALRVHHNSMNPEPEFSNYDVAGDKFFLDDGVLGMDLSPDGKFLYYSALSGSKQSRISTSDLRNGITKNIYTYPTPRKSQSAALAINKNGIAFFGLISGITLNCWNLQSLDYGQDIKTVYYNPETMQFPSGIKVITNPHTKNEELWVLTSRLQKFFTETGYDFKEVNFRISKFSVSSLEAHCKSPK